jgi:hypothetical protein
MLNWVMFNKIPVDSWVVQVDGKLAQDFLQIYKQNARIIIS